MATHKFDRQPQHFGYFFSRNHNYTGAQAVRKTFMRSLYQSCLLKLQIKANKYRHIQILKLVPKRHQLFES